jgi:hypothetical protein
MDVELSCRCGEVHGRVRDASPRTSNRLICYCDDCQAFLHHLGRKDCIDEHGGVDIVQVAPATLSFDRGESRIVGVRLTKKGLFRWYTPCCNTPLGNTVGPAIPFIGIGSGAFTDPDAAFGKPGASVWGKFAIGKPPKGSTGFDLRLFARIARLIFGWRLRGLTWPHPFFDRQTKEPTHSVTVLATAERNALRPLCGPLPSTVR